MSKKKERIPTSGPQGGLNSAFAHLDLPNAASLLQGPATPPPGAATPAPPKKMGRVVLRRECAHRGGKTVIVIHDFAAHLTLADIERVAGKVRSGCGCGGTVKDRNVEIQGDQPGKIRAILEAEGFQVAGV